MSDRRRVHDMGGLPAGPVDTADHEELPWHKLITAISAVLGPGGRRIIRVDERRRTTEDLNGSYHRLGYFDRSVYATASLMVEKGVLTEDEILERMAEFRARAAR